MTDQERAKEIDLVVEKLDAIKETVENMRYLAAKGEDFSADDAINFARLSISTLEFRIREMREQCANRQPQMA